MDWQHPFLVQLRRVVQTLDDDALVTIANRGLFRRARKDVDSQEIGVERIDDDSVTIRVGDCSVNIPPLLTLADCDCPANDICRHVLAALIYLRDQAHEETASDRESDPVSEHSDAMGKRREKDAPVVERSRESAGGSAGESGGQSDGGAQWESVTAKLGFSQILKWAGKTLLKRALIGLELEPEIQIVRQPSWACAANRPRS